MMLMQLTGATTSSSGADRARRYRERQAEGRHVARVEVDPEDVEALVANSLLAAGDVGDRGAMGEAIECLLYALSEGAVEIDLDLFLEAEAEPG